MVACSKNEIPLTFENTVMDQLLVPQDDDLIRSYYFGSDDMIDVYAKGNWFSDYLPYEMDGNYLVFPGCEDDRFGRWKIEITGPDHIKINNRSYLITEL